MEFGFFSSSRPSSGSKLAILPVRASVNVGFFSGWCLRGLVDPLTSRRHPVLGGRQTTMMLPKSAPGVSRMSGTDTGSVRASDILGTGGVLPAVDPGWCSCHSVLWLGCGTDQVH